MRDQDAREKAKVEDPNEQERKAEQKKKDKLPTDSLVDDNPLICRGTD